jgi:hypothetical protein
MKKVRLTGHEPGMEVIGSAYKILIRKYEGKRALGKTRRRWNNNITVYVKEIGYKCKLDLSCS